MEQRESSVKLSELPDQPIYNVKAVCMRTGITAATLRAWERRYGLPSPNRSTQGYRLYSERDVALLYWLMQQTATGVNISHASQQLAGLLASAQDLNVKIPPHHPQRGEPGPRSPEAIALELSDAYSTLDEKRADDLLTEAGALYTVETVLISIMRQAMLVLREEIRQQQVMSSAENMAHNHLRQRLLSLSQSATSSNATGQKIKRLSMVVGFADERTELELLILSTLMRRNGYPCMYLRAERDVPPLGRETSQTDIGAVLFYVDNPLNLNRLTSLPTLRDRHATPIRMLCAGQALELAPEMLPKLSLDYIGTDLRAILRDMLDSVRQLRQPVPIPVPLPEQEQS